ncbi:transporter substrate-binding domain-containing protein [Leucobacter chromiiresistens]|uniref:Amino acid ABC transporter substrate-binding protein n=1 Tax=Leucobacter chromiiresistens TaxID=1079994 RepID=A0A147E935_9MICO|nr:transporter substrate-binding domain-containing protein [Leucobacter chromiiresistens]KTR80881.1 amino acid ABC transporter substrate-binding protein [Leucobacter chromiiresistens]
MTHAPSATPESGARSPRRRLAALGLLAASALALTACSAVISDDERSGSGAAPEGAGPATTEAAFDLTTANLDTRPHIEAIPEAVEALEASGFEPVQPGRLTVAILGAGAPPTSFFAEDDAQTIIGSDADFASLISEGLGLEYTPENVAWADWPLGVESGKYDLALINIGVTEERKELFDFATYRDAVMAFSVAADSEISEIAEPADVSGLRVIVGSGTNQEQYLLDWFAQNDAAGIDAGEPVYYDDSAAGLLALTSGRADASIEPYALAAFREQTLGETRIVGKFNSAYPVDGQIGAVTAKGNGLVEPVQLVIASLMEHGQYDAVLERWGQTEEAVPESLINPPGLPKP